MRASREALAAFGDVDAGGKDMDKFRLSINPNRGRVLVGGGGEPPEDGSFGRGGLNAPGRVRVFAHWGKSCCWAVVEDGKAIDADDETPVRRFL
jgi:hypothetical protein